MMKGAVIGGAFLLIISLFGDAFSITVDEFLATARDDYTLNRQNEKIGFLNTTSSNTPFLDKIELRTETDEFEATRQQYSLRFYPNGWGETKSGKNVYETTLRCNETERDLVFHQALKRRYTLVVDFLHSRNLLELNKKLLILYEDRIHVLRRKGGSVDFDINDLIEAEDDYIRMQLKLIELENRKNSIEDEIRLYISKDAAIDFDPKTIAGTESLSKAIQQPGVFPENDHVYVRDSLASCELARCSYDLEKARSRKYLGFFEVHYDNEKRHNSREAVLLELGFRLPFINSDRLDTNRRMLDYLTEKGRHEELKRNLSEKVSLLSEDVKRLLQQYELLKAKKESGNAESSMESYQQLEGVDPLILLKIKESMVERDITLEEIQYAIYTTYIEFLDLTGKLSEKPLKNYLSSLQEEIIP